MECTGLKWPEPVVRVQSLAESGINAIPQRYVKPPSHRPSDSPPHVDGGADISIPVIDLHNLFNKETLNQISHACREWGFFQVVNHGVSDELMKETMRVWREFFKLPLEVKQEYSNSPTTYEGYGSRLGVEKGALLDWSDYFFLHYMPSSLRNPQKWPNLPPTCRKLIAEYGDEVVKLCGRLMKALSLSLELPENCLQNAFGGEDIGACLRVNFYPQCPQPDLTLGLSPHSDPGGMTILFPEDDVAGLQVRKGDKWVTVKPLSNAFIVNVGDQLQVVTNAIYKSVEHRVIVNSAMSRLSLAMFYNPRSDIPIQPVKELVNEDRPALYSPMTYDEYRMYIRMKGPCGKSQVESLKSLR